MVTFLKIDNGRIFYRNPQGHDPFTLAAKDVPRRRAEKGTNSVESMSLDEARGFVYAVIQR